MKKKAFLSRSEERRVERDSELTISKIASAKLIPGAISTEPVMT